MIPQVTEPDIDLASKEKTVSLDKQSHDEENKKKPRSLFRRLIKWTAILFVILLVLAILGKNNKQNSAIEPKSISGVPSQTMEEPLGTTSTSSVSSNVIEDSPDVKSDSKIVDDLLKGVGSNIKELKLTSPLGNNAYEKYQTVLNLDPKNPGDLNGLDSIVDKYINLMGFALGKDDIPRVRNYLDKGKRVNLNHDGLADAEKRYNAAVDAYKQAQIKYPLGSKL